MTTPFETSRSVDAADRGTSEIVGQNELDDVLEALRDGIRGYAALAEEVEDAANRALIEQRLAARRKTVDDLVVVAAELGYDVDEEPSLGAAFHRGWLKVKAALGGDRKAISAAIPGEKHALEEIDEALGADIPDPLAEAFRSARAAVEDDLAELEAAG